MLRNDEDHVGAISTRLSGASPDFIIIDDPMIVEERKKEAVLAFYQKVFSKYPHCVTSGVIRIPL